LTLGSVLDWVEGRGGCAGCPLYGMGRRPLVVKPSSEAGVKAVVVTESPWELNLIFISLLFGESNVDWNNYLEPCFC
jgi:hypothetical protein